MSNYIRTACPQALANPTIRYINSLHELFCRDVSGQTEMGYEIKAESKPRHDAKSLKLTSKLGRNGAV